MATHPRSAFACIGCGGSLLEVEPNGKCPGCGLAVGRSINLDAIDPVSMALIRDVPCTGCGYNLRTLDAAGSCPECNQPVVDSLRPDELRFANAKWLGQIRKGVTALLACAAVVTASIVGALIFLVISIVVSGPASVMPMPTSAMTALDALHAVNLGVFALSVFLITKPNPYPRVPQRALVATIARVGALITVGTGFLFVVAPSLKNSLPVALASSIGFSTTAALAFACLRRLAVLARRRGVRRLTTFMIWMLGTAALIGSLQAVVFRLIFLPAMAGIAAMAPPAPTTATTGSTAAPTETTAPSEDATLMGPLPPPTPPPATTGVAPTPPTFGVLFGVISCTSGLLYLICFVLGTIALVRYRWLLTEALEKPDIPLE